MRGLASGICKCEACEARTSDTYRMIGYCTNCGADVLMLYRAGDKAASLDCPVCGNWHTVQSKRLATPDELPMDYEQVAP